MRPPRDRRALVAIDLGAESCRVSLLRWTAAGPRMELVHRFANAAVERDGELRWDIAGILGSLRTGLRMCATIATEGVRSIGVDGWAVDYVRLDEHGQRLGEPFCYRDARTERGVATLNARVSAERMRELTGIQIVPLNTAYQMAADAENMRNCRWLNLPEYVLSTLGGGFVSERTNASHTQLLGLDNGWSAEILRAVELPLSAMPPLVDAGTDVGQLQGELSTHTAFAETRLIAPACHDTASAIAAVPDVADDWGYISSGTWSLVGTPLHIPNNSPAARAAGFGNLRGAGGTICFHKSVNGMWLLRQCMEGWRAQGAEVEFDKLIAAAEAAPRGEHLLDVDEPELLLPGDMPARIAAQFARRGVAMDCSCERAPEVASMLFHSLAARYAQVLRDAQAITGKTLRRLYVMGGGSRNELLNRLAAEATGLEVLKAGTECSTLGNFAVQLARIESGDVSVTSVAEWARALQSVSR